MCELTYAHLRCKEANALMVYLTQIIGSIKNDDGTGIVCQDGSIWKTKLKAEIISNLGEILHQYITDQTPIISHVRAATSGIAVTDENAHPFKGDSFILAHNGGLTLNESDSPELTVKTNRGDSDSMTFLKYLEAAKIKDPDSSFANLMQMAMSHFTGKFAFMIRDVGTNSDFIVRGKTAKLYITMMHTKGKKESVLGYVINTSNETLEKACMLFVNLYAMTTGINVEFTTPEILTEESIFVAAKSGITKIGELKETATIRVSQSTWVSQATAANERVISGGRWSSTSPQRTGEAKRALDAAETVAKFLEKHMLDETDFQRMFLLFTGVSSLEMTEGEIDYIITYVIPKIGASKNYIKEVKAFLGDQQTFPFELYKKHGLLYPWMLNEKKDLITALKKEAKSSKK